MLTTSESEDDSDRPNTPTSSRCVLITREDIIQEGGAPKKRKKEDGTEATEKYETKTQRIRILNDLLKSFSTRTRDSGVTSNVFEVIQGTIHRNIEKLKADTTGNRALTDLLHEYPFKDLEDYANNLSESSSNNVKSRIRELSDQVFNEEIDKVENLKSLATLSSKVFPIIMELVLVHRFADRSGAMSWAKTSSFLNKLVQKRKRVERRNGRDAGTDPMTDSQNESEDDDEADDDDGHDGGGDVKMIENFHISTPKKKVRRPPKAKEPPEQHRRSGGMEIDAVEFRMWPENTPKDIVCLL
eukprot:Skav213104  [mRNA]  locus=scaffold2769:232480:233379:- [translate_table: standard]